MSERSNQIFDEQSFRELEARVAKLTEKSEKDLQNEINNFDQINDQFNARLDKLWGKDSYYDVEVDKLLAQIQFEVNLEAKSTKLGDQKDQYIRDRLDKLKADSPIRRTFTELCRVVNQALKFNLSGKKISSCEMVNAQFGIGIFHF